MKNIIITAAAFLAISNAFAQQVPVTFETGENGADWTWTVFENEDNPALEIVENPSKTGINASNNVAKFTARATGAPYAGCESLHGSGIGNYKIDATNSTVTIMVYKSILSDVGIKLVTASGWSKGELKVANTKINEWEKLTFDFSKINHEDMTYDQIVIFPDFKTRATETVSYFDNITMGEKTAAIKIEQALDFEMYPNPTAADLHIKLPVQMQQAEVTLLDAQGKEVYNQLLKDGESSTTISTVGLENGIYVVHIKSTAGATYQKVLVL